MFLCFLFGSVPKCPSPLAPGVPGCVHGNCSTTQLEHCDCEPGWGDHRCSTPICTEGCVIGKGVLNMLFLSACCCLSAKSCEDPLWFLEFLMFLSTTSCATPFWFLRRIEPAMTNMKYHQQCLPFPNATCHCNNAKARVSRRTIADAKRGTVGTTATPPCVNTRALKAKGIAPRPTSAPADPTTKASPVK